MPPRPPLTHFLCLPLVTSASKAHLLASLQQFTAHVVDTENEDSAIVPAKAVRPIGTLHLTLGVMSLQTPERVAVASAFLQSLNVRELLRGATITGHKSPAISAGAAERTDILPGLNQDPEAESRKNVPRLIITLSGLHPMHTPSSTSILYASPLDHTSRLYPFALALRNAFTDADFLLPEDRDLRLHATIVNTIYAKDKKTRTRDGGHGKNIQGSRKFDARELIANYEDFEWTTNLHIERVCICEMGAKKVVENGQVVNEEYLEISSVSLP